MAEDLTGERLIALVGQLDAATRSGQVQWQLAEDDRHDSFTYVTPAGAVTIFTRDNDGRDPYVMIIRDSEGRLVERSTLWWNSPYCEGDLYERFVRLYQSVRRQVLHTGDVIEALLRELG